jgi:DNA repair protein RecO
VTPEDCTGFVLRTWPLRESDLIVTVFTRSEGKIRGVAHRATRPKSKWLGALEALTEIGIDWRSREGQELVSFTDVSILRSPYHPQPGLGPTWAMAHVAELLDESTGLLDPDEVLYRLIGSAVQALTSEAPPIPVARYVETWVLRLAGVLPDLRACAACGANLEGGGGSWQWNIHGIGCARCVDVNRTEGPAVFPADLAWLRATRRTGPDRLAQPEGRSMKRIGVFLNHLVRDFLGKELKSERFLDELERLESPRGES